MKRRNHRLLAATTVLALLLSFSSTALAYTFNEITDTTFFTDTEPKKVKDIEAFSNYRKPAGGDARLEGHWGLPHAKNLINDGVLLGAWDENLHAALLKMNNLIPVSDALGLTLFYYFGGIGPDGFLSNPPHTRKEVYKNSADLFKKATGRALSNDISSEYISRAQAALIVSTAIEKVSGGAFKLKHYSSSELGFMADCTPMEDWSASDRSIGGAVVVDAGATNQTISGDPMRAVNMLMDIGVMRGRWNEDGTVTMEPDALICYAEFYKLLVEVASKVPVDPDPDPDPPEPPDRKYTVTFINTDGSETYLEVPDGSTIPAGQIPVILDLPEYEELGWSLDGIATVDPSAVSVTSDLTFTVKKLPVMPVLHKVTFINTDGSETYLEVPDGSTIPAGQIPAILDLPEYEELGWSLDGTATVDPSAVSVTSDLTFTVKKLPVVPVLHKVTFINTDGSETYLEVPDGSTVPGSQIPAILDLPEYEELGWSLDGIATVDPSTVTVTSDLTFTVKKLPVVPVLHKVTFINTDGSETYLEVPDGSTVPGSQIPAILDLPEYEELGWSLDGIATVDPSTIAVHINLTFTVLTNALTQSSPRPYNKQNALASGADYTNPVDGYIEALNYADHLIVTIPGMLTSENVTVSAMAGTIFKFYYSGPEEKDPLPLSVEFSNMAADLAGIHFTLKPSSDAESATIFNAVMDNAGTSATGEGYMLYITATPVIDGIPGAESSMTEFHVPRYYTLTGTLESYAPGHIATLTILEETEGADVAEPLTMTVEVQNEGWDLWSQDFAFRSSELADKTFTLTIDKIGNIFYTRTNIVLTTSVATNFTFTLDNGASIALIPGDINGDGLVNTTDRAYLSSVLRDPTADAAVEGSLAYRADLNGDGVVTVADSAILAANLRSSTDSYGNPTGLNWKL